MDIFLTNQLILQTLKIKAFVDSSSLSEQTCKVVLRSCASSQSAKSSINQATGLQYICEAILSPSPPASLSLLRG